MPYKLTDKKFLKLSESAQKEVAELCGPKESSDKKKKSQSAYNIYIKENYHLYKGDKEAMAKLGASWKALDEEGKKSYVDKSNAGKVSEGSSEEPAPKAPRKKKAVKEVAAEVAASEEVKDAVVEVAATVKKTKVKKVVAPAV
jgi:hypothetical protein